MTKWYCGVRSLVVCAVLLATEASARADTWVYVTNNLADSVSVIDADSNTLIKTIPVGSFPEGLGAHLDARGALVYVANHGYPGAYGTTVSVIRGLTVTDTVTVGLGPRGVALNPRGGYAYVANSEEDTVSVVDTNIPATIATVPVGLGPTHIAVHPQGTLVYVTNALSNDVSVIDTNTNTVVDTIAMGAEPHGVDIDPSGSPLYVAKLNGTLAVIDTGDDTITKNIAISPCPAQPAVHPSGDFVYVTSGCSSEDPQVVSVVDTTSNTVVATTSVGLGDFVEPHGIEVDPDGTDAYIANIRTNSVAVLNTTTNTIDTTIALPDVGEPGNFPVDVVILDGLCLDPTDTDSDGIGDACDPDDDNDGCSDSVDDDPKSDTEVVGTWTGVFCNPQSGVTYGFSGADSDGDGLLDCRDDDDDNDGIPDSEDPCSVSGPTVLCTTFRDCPEQTWWFLCGADCIEYLVLFDSVVNPAPVVIDTFQIVNETLFLKPNGANSLADLANTLSGQELTKRVAAAAGTATDADRSASRLEIWTRGASGLPGRFVTQVAEFEPRDVRIGDLRQGRWLAVTPAVDGSGTLALASSWTPGAGPGGTVVDSDSDGLPDPFDNCLSAPNASQGPGDADSFQRDTDGDRFGNVCDGDFDNDGAITKSDRHELSCVLHARCDYDPNVDMNGDGKVTQADVALWRHGKEVGVPGPSGVLEPFAVSLPETPTPQEPVQERRSGSSGNNREALRADLLRRWSPSACRLSMLGHPRGEYGWVLSLLALVTVRRRVRKRRCRLPL